jgi:hypothetical protein
LFQIPPAVALSLRKNYSQKRQIDQIINYKGSEFWKKENEEWAKHSWSDERPLAGPDDAWDIIITKEEIRGATYMTNFNMEGYFKHIGIDIDLADWYDNPFVALFDQKEREEDKL